MSNGVDMWRGTHRIPRETRRQEGTDSVQNQLQWRQNDTKYQAKLAEGKQEQ